MDTKEEGKFSFGFGKNKKRKKNKQKNKENEDKMPAPCQKTDASSALEGKRSEDIELDGANDQDYEEDEGDMDPQYALHRKIIQMTSSLQTSGAGEASHPIPHYTTPPLHTAPHHTT